MANQHHCLEISHQHHYLEISKVYITDKYNEKLFPDDSYCSIVFSLTAGDKSKIEEEKNVDMDGNLKYPKLVFAINDHDNQVLDINLKSEVLSVFGHFAQFAGFSQSHCFCTRKCFDQADMRIEDLFRNQNGDPTERLLHYQMDMKPQRKLHIFYEIKQLSLSRFPIFSSSNDLLYWVRSILRTIGSQIDHCVGAPFN